MEPERFEVSPLKPSWVLLHLTGYYYFVTHFSDALAGPAGWIVLLVIIFFPIIIWKYIRLFVRLITLKPAVLLTDKSVYIAESNYTIEWVDVTDVYFATNINSYNPEMVAKDTFYIIFKVSDPEKYLSEIQNPLLRAYRKLTAKLKPSPFEIKLSWVRGDEDELYQIVRSYFKYSRQH